MDSRDFKGVVRWAGSVRYALHGNLLLVSIHDLGELVTGDPCFFKKRRDLGDSIYIFTAAQKSTIVRVFSPFKELIPSIRNRVEFGTSPQAAITNTIQEDAELFLSTAERYLDRTATSLVEMLKRFTRNESGDLVFEGHDTEPLPGSEEEDDYDGIEGTFGYLNPERKRKREELYSKITAKRVTTMAQRRGEKAAAPTSPAQEPEDAPSDEGADEAAGESDGDASPAAAPPAAAPPEPANFFVPDEYIAQPWLQISATHIAALSDTLYCIMCPTCGLKTHGITRSKLSKRPFWRFDPKNEDIQAFFPCRHCHTNVPHSVLTTRATNRRELMYAYMKTVGDI